MLAELGIAPLRVSPAPDAAELVLLAHARRVHDTLGCRSFLVASADRRFAELATLGRLELLVWQDQPIASKLHDAAHQVHRIPRPTLTGSEPSDPEPDLKPEPAAVPADRVPGLPLTGPLITALATGVGIGIGQRVVDVLLGQCRPVGGFDGLPGIVGVPSKVTRTACGAGSHPGRAGRAGWPRRVISLITASAIRPCEPVSTRTVRGTTTELRCPSLREALLECHDAPDGHSRQAAPGSGPDGRRATPAGQAATSTAGPRQTRQARPSRQGRQKVVADAEALRQCMVEGLARRGELDERWRAAFTEVPRHEFIPELVWRHDRDAGRNCDLVSLRRCDDPQRWLERAYANAPVNTQVDDGHPIGEAGCGFEVTSSASMPAVVAQMLAALDAEPGMRVLEIGTGTGYNAALLAHRLGAEHIVSVEVDPAVAEHARRVLATAGFDAVTIVTADGADGYLPRAPYDRVISTVATAEVPYAWVAQTRPGGLVLTPWGTPYYPGGLLALTVHPDATATGRIVGPAAFMSLRAQRIPRYTISRIVREDDTATTSTTDLHPWHVAGDAHVSTAIGLRVPQCARLYQPEDPETGTLYLVDQWSRSWATLHVSAEPPYEVRHSGERKLWDEVATAYQWWLDRGKPAVDAWRFTIDPSGQRIELLPSSSS